MRHKGFKHSEETKLKMSLASKGRPKSVSHRKSLSVAKTGTTSSLAGRKRPDLSGPNNPRWRGGISKNYKSGYYSLEYKHWRTSVFERDNYTCQSCGATNCYLTAHHVKSFAHFPEFRLDIENGQTLCEPCHMQTDNYKGRAHRLLTQSNYRG